MTSKAERLSTNYASIDNLAYIDAEDLIAIEINAKILTIEECYALLFIMPDELSEHEDYCANMAHTRGRKKALVLAADNLFSQMGSRNGSVACMSYLQQMSGNFSLEVTPSPGSTSGFSFNVFMPEDEEKNEKRKDMKI